MTPGYELRTAEGVALVTFACLLDALEHFKTELRAHTIYRAADGVHLATRARIAWPNGVA